MQPVLTWPARTNVQPILTIMALAYRTRMQPILAIMTLACPHAYGIYPFHNSLGLPACICS